MKFESTSCCSQIVPLCFQNGHMDRLHIGFLKASRDLKLPLSGKVTGPIDKFLSASSSASDVSPPQDPAGFKLPTPGAARLKTIYLLDSVERVKIQVAASLT